MLYHDHASCKHASSSDFRCPLCGGEMVWNGGWTRPIDRLEGHVVVTSTTFVRQLRCKRCGDTHGVLTRGMLPGTPLTVGVLMLLLAMRLAGRTRAEAAAVAEATVAAVRRAEDDAERIALAVNGGMAAIGAVLASPADGDAGLPARFLAAFGTLPFSRVSVYPSGVAERAPERPVPPSRTRWPAAAAP